MTRENLANRGPESTAQAELRWLAELSHEIRTPTVGIVGAAELLALTDLDDEQEALVQTVLQGATWLVSLLNDVLAHARLEHATPEVTLGPTDIRRLVDDVGQQFALLARAKGVQWRSEVDADIPESILGNGGMLRQVLANLISNAVKLTSSGHVELRALCPATARLRFEIEDTGPGVPPGFTDRLFEPYSTCDVDSRAPSTGLGLSISRRLVDLMGGSIGVIPNEPRGSVFYFEIEAPETTPVRDPDDPAPQRVSRARVLLVEDHEVTRVVTGQMIENLGHQVHTVEDGAQAVAAATEASFDLVLMDCDLPLLNGFEATRQIRNGRHGDVPVVGFSADEPSRILARCIEAGMNGCLAKPIRLADLQRAIGTYARPAAA